MITEHDMLIEEKERTSEYILELAFWCSVALASKCYYDFCTEYCQRDSLVILRHSKPTNVERWHIAF